MQRHAEGHGHLWQKQAIVLNEQQEGLKTDKQTMERTGPLENKASAGAGESFPVTKATGGTTSKEKPPTSERMAGVIGPVGMNAIEQ